MKRRILLIISLSQFLILSTAWGETDNTGAVWTEVGISKSLPHNLSIDASFEHRTLDWFDWSSRWNIGAGLSYKISKYFKVGVSYTFIQKHYQEENKYKYGSLDYSDYQGQSVVGDDGATYYFKGYNNDAANWANRHRVAFDITGSKKFRKVLRIGIRERYQFTHQAARDVDRIKYREPVFNPQGELIEYEDEESTIDHKLAKNRHILRSRLKFSFDKKGLNWEPYVSLEAHNNLGDKMHLDKVRMQVGVDYKITKQHELGLGYIFNHENDDDGDQNIHAISVGYNFKF